MKKIAFIVDESIIASETPLPEHHYCVALPITEKPENIEYDTDNKISFAEIKAKLVERKILKTSAIIMGECHKLINDLLKKYDYIFVCGISPNLSSSFSNWKLLIKDLDVKNKITILENYIIGEKFFEYSKKALDTFKKNKSLDEIIKIFYPSKIFKGILLVQDLFYLHAGGRISNLKLKLGSFLKIKILISYNQKLEGKLNFFAKEKSMVKILKQIKNFVIQEMKIDLEKPNQLHLLSSFINQENWNKIYSEIQLLFPNTKFIITEIPKPILVHVGINALAICL